MKITSIQALLVPTQPTVPLRIALPGLTHNPALLVRVNTSAGIAGFGEACPFVPVTGNNLRETQQFVQAMSAQLAGKDPLCIERIHRAMDACDLGNSAAKAAIDIALYDIMGKHANLPLYKLLGGNENTTKSDMTIGLDEPSVMAQKARRYVREGFFILKIKVGLNPTDDLEAIRLIRAAVGPKVSLRLDANQGWSTEQAIATMQAMELYDVDEIEQPIAKDDYAGLKTVRAHIKQDLVLDETVCSPQDAARALAAGTGDIVNIKLMKCGGLYRALQINAVAEAAGAPCMVGCMSETRVSIAAGAALAVALGNICYTDLDSHCAIAEIDGIRGGFEQRGETITMLEKPGLGLDIDLDFGKEIL
ncbi:MAG: dipeptide epimerase [Coriobacteriales bacterium]|jgi:L-alanine-DL-glutamate epimerase-like enolase superfamily enzyme|nr:dipeptide epimerase [Coriobacteriales bacterium]